MSTTRRGVFITFEGPDGRAKPRRLTTVLTEACCRSGQQMLENGNGRNPGGQRIRRICLIRLIRKTAGWIRAIDDVRSVLPNMSSGLCRALEQEPNRHLGPLYGFLPRLQGAGRGLGNEDRAGARPHRLPGLGSGFDGVRRHRHRAGLARARASLKHGWKSRPSISPQGAGGLSRTGARTEPRRFGSVAEREPPDAIAAKVWEQIAPVASCRQPDALVARRLFISFSGCARAILASFFALAAIYRLCAGSRRNRRKIRPGRAPLCCEFIFQSSGGSFPSAWAQLLDDQFRVECLSIRPASSCPQQSMHHAFIGCSFEPQSLRRCIGREPECVALFVQLLFFTVHALKHSASSLHAVIQDSERSLLLKSQL